MNHTIADPIVETGASVLLIGSEPSAVRAQFQSVLARDAADASVLLTTGNACRSVDALVERGISRDALGVVDASGAPTIDSGLAEVEAVDGPGALSCLGIEASGILERLASRYEHVYVGVNCVTQLLDSQPVSVVFRFLHVLRRRVSTAGAVLVATIDRSAHEPDEVGVVEALFDQVVDVDVPAERGC